MEFEYRIAQQAIADLKSAIFSLLTKSSAEGLRNVEIGHALGIYTGHEGHIPRVLLAIMENEGVFEQDSETKKWKLAKLVDE